MSLPLTAYRLSLTAHRLPSLELVARALAALRALHYGSLQVGSEQLDELVDIAAQIGVAADGDVRCAGLEQVTRVDHAQAQVARRIERHLGQYADAEAHLDISLDYVRI